MTLYQHMQSMETGTNPESAPFFPPRGVSPSILLAQTKNTVPFIFDRDFLTAPARENSYLHALLELDKSVTALARSGDAGTPLKTSPQLTHSQYFELCLAAHHATVASFVPTDVDNQIRFRLWHPALD